MKTMNTFADLGVPTDLVDALASQGITSPTPVQAATLAGALDGRDVAAQAPTGSGKTLAFGLPMLVRSNHGTPRRPASLVLVPTRELATQIVDALTPLAGRDGLRITAVFGGVGARPQIQALRRGVDIVVGCPGRLEDLISQKALDLSDVNFAVIDEADRMADVGFMPAVRRLLDQTKRSRQTLVFSATLGGPVGKMIDKYQKSPERHDIAGPKGQRSTARHIAVAVPQDERTKLTAEAIRAGGSAIVFTRTRHRADRVAKQLARLGVEAAPIHGGRSQPQRTKALDALHSGRIKVLVATDVAARGIHVDDLSVVVHYDPPGDHETYVHRSGRTGRAGAGGVVLNLVEPSEIRRGELRSSAIPRDTRVELIDIGDLSNVLRKASSAASSSKEASKESAAQPTAKAEAKASAPSKPRENGARPSTSAVSRTGDAADGTIKFFHSRRGFGFIESPEHGDLFVHHTQLRNRFPKDIRDGEAVRFTVGEGPKGLQAMDVELV